MKNENLSSRRNFMGTMAAGAAGLSLLSNPLMADAPASLQLKTRPGLKDQRKHKIVYDAPEPHDGFPDYMEGFLQDE
jgi:hypothetical protein